MITSRQPELCRGPSGVTIQTPPMMFHDKGPKVNQTIKAHLLASQQLLVTSLYNVAPLLDSLLAASLLSQDNYQDIKAEKTPQKKARKLLEIVQAEMDEEEASRFLECLRECKQHYPRLRTWLFTDPDIQRGPTERQLKTQFYSLCSRLGSSVLPVSLALFSNSTLTQFELERVQAVLTPTQQTQTLLSICLTKGEAACKSFYTALYNEDLQLAEDLNVTNLAEHMPNLSLNTVAMAVEETQGGNLPYSGVLQTVRAQLGVTVGEEARLNICELGVAVGLPRSTVRDCLMEGVSIDDAAQLEALVALFLEKTQDENRLLSRVAELGIQRFQLSERGRLSLKLLQEAESLLRSGSHSHRYTWDHLHDQDHLHSLEPHYDGGCRDQCTVWTIFGFLVWDCLAVAVEEPDPEPKPSASLIGTLQQLRGSEQVEAVLLKEVEQCWNEGGADNLLQSIRVLAQILRDLHPLEDCIRLSASAEGVYTLKPCQLHRVTSFQGVSARVIRKALSGIAPTTMTEDATPQAQQYREVCAQAARLLDTVQPDRSNNTDLTKATIAQISQHISLTLSKPTFGFDAFSVGVRHRLLSLVKFNPTQLGLCSLMQLHRETLSELQCYLQPSECHGFRFVPESVRILGQPRLLSVASVRGPVAIDNGMEEDFCFVTSQPACFLVRIRCFGFEEGKGHFDVSKPRCLTASHLGSEGARAVGYLGGEIVAEEDDKMWIREGGSGWREELQSVALRHSIQLRDEGCCFRVLTSEVECEVRFMYRGGRLWATAQRNCEVI